MNFECISVKIENVGYNIYETLTYSRGLFYFLVEYNKVYPL